MKDKSQHNDLTKKEENSQKKKKIETSLFFLKEREEMDIQETFLALFNGKNH